MIKNSYNGLQYINIRWGSAKILFVENSKHIKYSVGKPRVFFNQPSVIFGGLFGVFQFESSWKLLKFILIHNNYLSNLVNFKVKKNNNIVVIIGYNHNKYSSNTIISPPFFIGGPFKGNAAIFYIIAQWISDCFYFLTWNIFLGFNVSVNTPESWDFLSWFEPLNIIFYHFFLNTFLLAYAFWMKKYRINKSVS